MGSSGPTKHWHYWKWGKKFLQFKFYIVRIINGIDFSPIWKEDDIEGETL